MGPPAPRPCVSCSYRRDVLSGVWDFDEYQKLRAYDGDMGVQAPQLFQCHQTGADSTGRRMCAGWVGCHGGRALLALRLALIQDRIGAKHLKWQKRTSQRCRCLPRVPRPLIMVSGRSTSPVLATSTRSGRLLEPAQLWSILNPVRATELA
ncbi:DUF6283 family protein [Nocardia salmonicida]|uniref:DUF6283 family protein n=1 Tax=Nocardia salmonicida TaxID=53431 RepID=UPI003CE8DCFA